MIDKKFKNYCLFLWGERTNLGGNAFKSAWQCVGTAGENDRVIVTNFRITLKWNKKTYNTKLKKENQKQNNNSFEHL